MLALLAICDVARAEDGDGRDDAGDPGSTSTTADTGNVGDGGAGVDESGVPPIPRSGGADVVVGATRWEVEERTVPRSTWVIPADDVTTRTAPFNLPEAFAQTPGVNVQGTGRWMGSPFVHGLTGYYNLVMVDGVRLNNSILRAGPNQYLATVDALMLTRSELVFGVGSVLYGSDAIGGTIHLVSQRWQPRKAGDDDAPDVAHHLYLRGGTAERSLTGRYDTVIDFGDAGLVIGFTGKMLGNLIAGSGVLPYTRYDELHGNARYTRLLGNGLTLDVLLQAGIIEDGPRTHRTVHAVPFAGTSVGSDLQREFDHVRGLAAVQLRHDDAKNTFYDRMLLSLSWHGQFEERFRERGSLATERQGADVHTIGLLGQFETALGDDHTLTYGIDAYLDRVESFKIRFDAAGVRTTDEIQGPVGDDAFYLITGLFIEDEWFLADEWVLTIGARGTLAVADVGEMEDPVSGLPTTLSRTFAGGAAHAGIQWFFHDDSSAFLNVSQGFRAPNLSDLSRLDEARTNEIETPSPWLDPELFVLAEIGLKVAEGPLDARLSVWGMLIDGMIIRQPTGVMIGSDNEVTKRNAGDGFSVGVEARVQWAPIAELAMLGQVAWMYGEVDTYPTSAPVVAREVLSRLPPLSGMIGIRAQIPGGPGGKPIAWAELFVVLTDAQTQLSTRDAGDTSRIPPGGTPAWFTLNVRVAWNIAKGQTLFAQLLNFTDENYRRHGSGTNEPGIGLVAGLEWFFD